MASLVDHGEVPVPVDRRGNLGSLMAETERLVEHIQRKRNGRRTAYGTGLGLGEG